MTRIFVWLSAAWFVGVILLAQWAKYRQRRMQQVAREGDISQIEERSLWNVLDACKVNTRDALAEAAEAKLAWQENRTNEAFDKVVAAKQRWQKAAERELEVSETWLTKYRSRPDIAKRKADEDADRKWKTEASAGLANLEDEASQHDASNGAVYRARG